jgi:hypothetical protein
MAAEKRSVAKQTPIAEARIKKGSKRDAGRGKAWTFPRHTLEQAVRVAQAIEEKNAGNPMHAAELARAVGFRKPNDWRFLELLRSANQYGLTKGTGQKTSVSLEKLGQDIVAPSSPQQRQDALRNAFLNVPDFKKVDDFYGGKRIPEDEFFLNTLTRQFGISRDRVDRFSEIFLANRKFLKAFFAPTAGSSERGIDDERVEAAASDLQTSDPASAPSERPLRKFLDTCFVMMPFGEWFDRYYREVYSPAVREAGFEPIRADELFSIGSVVEQIWEQIDKAKVLLADLSDKNPNVFYELGLAHLARKPVVLTAARIDDVPFDLRHLRVITYDVRETQWAAKLQKAVTDYLKNAVKEPEKTIPHPFRAMFGGEQEEEEETDQSNAS